jgi:hypothetical protein
LQAKKGLGEGSSQESNCFSFMWVARLFGHAFKFSRTSYSLMTSRYTDEDRIFGPSRRNLLLR